ncbi:transposase, mutator type [Mycoplasmopsis maculosa]|uniref:Transposase, mutator type n=2 Tax=Mycoplasmopsis maculosa TaxID=114885 RepID=A0A449B3Q8_9BACT|nr:transposase [Mycoplasmopsis maculosa]VEU75227.1 transposase, mutator type [Mycoplasmopsis maculosa]
MKNYLGYNRYEHEKSIKDNYRNGSYSKNVRSNFGEIELEIPRDRKFEFEPKIVKNIIMIYLKLRGKLLIFIQKVFQQEIYLKV